ncbi:MAG: response regulator [Lachnospiraceae bacterium]|nr:response regulator [Lachnospiraceae bacterium]
MKLKDLKILIADDSLLARKKLKDCLIGLGCQDVLEAVDGQAAVDIFKSELPDIVFMDIVMPVKTGLEALDDIIKYNPSSKVVMLSSTGTKANITSAIKSGACEFLIKPFTTNQVQDILTKLSEGVE